VFGDADHVAALPSRGWRTRRVSRIWIWIGFACHGPIVSAVLWLAAEPCCYIPELFQVGVLRLSFDRALGGALPNAAKAKNQRGKRFLLFGGVPGRTRLEGPGVLPKRFSNMRLAPTGLKGGRRPRLDLSYDGYSLEEKLYAG